VIRMPHNIICDVSGCTEFFSCYVVNGTYRQLAVKGGMSKGGGNSGKQPPKTCPGYIVPEPYPPHDWALVPANPASKAEY
jgi:hypothetical protein